MHELCSGRPTKFNSFLLLGCSANWGGGEDGKTFEETETESMRIFSCGRCFLFDLYILLDSEGCLFVPSPACLFPPAADGMMLQQRRTIRNASQHLTFPQKYDMTTNNLEMPMWPIVFRLRCFVVIAAAEWSSLARVGSQPPRGGGEAGQLSSKIDFEFAVSPPFHWMRMGLPFRNVED